MRCLPCAVSWATWLLLTGVLARCFVLCVRCPGLFGSCSPVCPLGVCVACAVSWVTWLLFSGVPARHVASHVRCPGPLGSCSPVCWLVVLCCVCGVLGHLAPVHLCACWLGCAVCAVSGATWLLFTGVFVRCFLLCVRCPGPRGSCSPVCLLGGLCCMCGVLGLVFTGVLAPWVVLHVQCPGPLGSCSPVCWLGAVCCVSGVLGHLAPVHQCARSVHCAADAVSRAT